MRYDDARKIRPGKQIVCWNKWEDSVRPKRVTVERTSGKWKDLVFLVRDRDGVAYKVRMDRCKFL